MIIDDNNLEPHVKSKKIFEEITYKNTEDKYRIKPRFVDSTFLNKCKISEDDIDRIEEIVNSLIQNYIKKLEKDRNRFSKKYDIQLVLKKGGDFIIPKISRRAIQYGRENRPDECRDSV